ncbi:hypothetical protein H0O02_01655 [Candidatus Micrarchaeota archaeon]|nr:hypothetical protein [Candidatus Micrarchaeota archaeon]
MSNVTLYVPENVKEEMDEHDEIRWSEVVRKAVIGKLKELKKLELLRKYVEKESFTEEDWKWMDENDWHPVDEKEMKLGFIEEMQKRSKERAIQVKKIEDLFK